MGNIFTDWLSFRMKQKTRDLKMAGRAKAGQKLFGAVKKGQEGIKNKVKGKKGGGDDDDDDDDDDDYDDDDDDDEAPRKRKRGAAMRKKGRRKADLSGKTVAIRLDDVEDEPLEVVGWIVALNGNHRGQDFRLHTGKNVIGTAADCDIVLTDPYLSAKHAVIRHDPTDGSFTIIDLDSTNGTYLNDKRLTKEELIDNDTIRFGRTEMKFKALF